MLVSMGVGADEPAVRALMERAAASGLSALRADLGGVVRVCLGGTDKALEAFAAKASDGVAGIQRLDTPWKLAHKDVQPGGSTIHVGGVPFGGPGFVVIAGPCSVESYAQLRETADAVAAAGAACLRGGAFKPRTNPYSFQGLGDDGVSLMHRVSQETHLPAFTEALSPDDVPTLCRAVGAIQIGSRSMQNTPLLRRAARSGMPILLKRGLAANLTEVLLAAEYVMAHGNPHVILCERGIRTFEPATRNTLDLAGAVWLKQHTHLPVIVDPSHATGDRALIEPMCLATAAAGLDGLIVEVHPRPAEALSDGPQAMLPRAFAEMMTRLRAVLSAVGRPLWTHAGAAVAD